MQALIIQLHGAGEHEHVIAALQAALINGQAQPWMYEVLALSMELAGHPHEDVERVVLSLNDFGRADFSSMMYSAAYLMRFERREAALRLYRQASSLAPDRPEPYLLALKHARHVRSADAVAWAACGILEHAWTRDYVTLHREAENALLEARQWLQESGDADGARDVAAAAAEARRRDLVVRLEWSGAGDLDLLVEEPAGTVCSFEHRDSPGGGVLTHDGFGPTAANCYDEYISALASPGAYRIVVRHAWGNIVGKRATLRITRNAGTPEEQIENRPVVLDGGDVVVLLELAEGRRTQLKTVATFDVLPVPRFHRRMRQRETARDRQVRQAAGEEFTESRNLAAGRVGAVGFQPIVEIIPEGSQLTAGAVVSADRRYVRLSMFPLFTNITDVFTFSFITGGGGGGNGGGAMGPPLPPGAPQP